MATVITNLLSAIPVFGQDLVESTYVTELFSCLVYKGNNFPVLATIGTVSTQALKKGRKLRFNDKKEYLSIPYKFIAFLVGLIDGDGYIQITKTTKGYIAIKLIICLSLEDISSLEYIYSVFKIGKLQIYRDIKNPICKLVISKTDLQEVIFPLLIHHNIYFLTESRRAQFDLAMLIIKNDLKLFNQISNYNKVPTFFVLPKTASEYLSLAFFKNWLVGFTNANKYQELQNFIQEKPLNYKRVKSELKNLFSDRKSYYFLLKFLRNKVESPTVRKANYQRKDIRKFSTNALSDITYSKPILAPKIVKREIVVWGENLCSTVGYGRYTKIVKQMVKLPYYQESVIIGIILSDGHLFSSHENPSLEFKQSFKNSLYVWFVFSILSHYCNRVPYPVKSIRNGKVHFALRMYTRGLPCFNTYRDLFYINKIKIIPEDIYNLLTPVALAHLIMGDGKGRKHGLNICLDSYNLKDIIRLMNVLIIKYNLDCTLHYHTPTQPRIYIRQRSMDKLRSIVKHYMIPSMYYKIGIS